MALGEDKPGWISIIDGEEVSESALRKFSDRLIVDPKLPEHVKNHLEDAKNLFTDRESVEQYRFEPAIKAAMRAFIAADAEAGSPDYYAENAKEVKHLLTQAFEKGAALRLADPSFRMIQNFFYLTEMVLE